MYNYLYQTLIRFAIFQFLQIPFKMKKFIVETYYTCTFKTVHRLDNLNDQEMSKIDGRTDGEVEVIDVKLNNRKTKKIGDKKKTPEKEKKHKKCFTNINV